MPAPIAPQLQPPTRLRRPRRKLYGQHFGDLTVIGHAPCTDHPQRWLCRCACGVEVPIRSTSLQPGRTQSCGCKRRKNMRAIGLSRRQKRLYSYGTQTITLREFSYLVEIPYSTLYYRMHIKNLTLTEARDWKPSYVTSQ